MKRQPIMILRAPVALRRSTQTGMTLVELLVAMAVGLVVVLAAVAALLASRGGSVAVDASSQLRDNARFATDLVQRLADQAGFEDFAYARKPYAPSVATYMASNGTSINSLRPSVYGFNNGRPSTSDPLNSTTAWPSTSDSKGSDILILQYQPVQNSLDAVSGTASDGSMILCDGTAPTSSAIDRADRLVSILYVSQGSDGEPSLSCMTRNESTGNFYSTPLVRGVEQFQVLYGVDNVSPGAAPTGNSDSVPDRFLRADQLTVSGNEVATYANWRRVRSIRIGMVLRGPVGSALSSTTQSIHSFGNAAFDSSADVGSAYTASDSRLRQTVTYTIQLRNCPNQGYQPESSTTPCDVVMPS